MASASSFLRSRTFFGYRTSAKSLFMAAILPPAPSASSAASRYSGRGIRRPRSTEETSSSPYPMAAPNAAWVRLTASRHSFNCRETVRMTAPASSSSGLASQSLTYIVLPSPLTPYGPDATAHHADSPRPHGPPLFTG